MTLTSRGRLARYGALLAGMVAALLLLAGAQASLSNAAVQPVRNPGTFVATWNTGQFKMGTHGSLTWPLASLRSGGGNMTVTIQVNADGTFTATPSAFTNSPNLGTLGPNSNNVRVQNGYVTPIAEAGWSGTIDPRTGDFVLNAPLRMDVDGSQWQGYAVFGYVNITNQACAITDTLNAQARSDNGGDPYQIVGGVASVRAVANNFAITNGGAPCNRTYNVVSNVDVGPAVLQQIGMRSGSVNNAAGVNFLNMGMTFNTPILPRYINPAIKSIQGSAQSGFAAVGQPVTLSAEDSEIYPGSGVEQCDDPSPAEPDCGYRWDFDGNGTIDEVTNTPTADYTYGSEDVYNPTVTIFDTSGYSYEATMALNAQNAPIAQIDTTPAAITAQTSNAFTFSIPSNPYSATTECSVDGAAFAACDSGDSFEFVQADDTSGSHSFRVRGVTPGGVVGPAAEHNFTIDRVKPRVTIAPGSLPANPTNSTSANFTFTADKPNSTLECQLDGGSWVPCGTNSTGSQSYTNLSQSSPNPVEAPNPHEFRVRATDEYGNVGGDGNPGGGGYDWDIDLTAPVPTFADVPVNPTNEVSPLVTWSNNESVDGSQCRLSTNGVLAPWGDCDSLTSIQFTDMVDNQYAVSVTVKDIAGNWSSVVTHNWVLDTVAPDLDITSGPALLAKRSMAQFLFDHEAGADLTCQLDSQPVQDPCPSGVKYQNLAEGAHVFTVTATDAATNFTTKSYAWSVKTVQPVVAIEESSVPASSSTVDTADFELVTAHGDAECRLDGAAWSSCDSNAGQSYEDLGDGNHTFEVRAVDTYGNVSPIDAYSWLVVTAGPEVEFTSTPDEDTRHTTASFGFDVTSADANVTTECSLNGLDPFDCSDPAAVAGLADGDHSFTVSATDTAGIQGSDTYEWNVKAKIPGLGFDATPASISNSAAANFAFSSDEDPDVGYECKLDSAAWAGCDSPVSLSSLGQGNHTFGIRATDSVGNVATESYTWRVDTIAPTVTYGTKPPATTVDVAELISFTASESNVTFECKLDSGNFAACTSPTLLKNLAVGGHTFTVKATDEAGNTGADAVTTWTIGAVAPSGGAGAQSSGAGDVAPAAASPSGAALNAAAPAATTVNKAKVANVKAKTRKAKARARARAKARVKARAKAKRAKVKQRRARR